MMAMKMFQLYNGTRRPTLPRYKNTGNYGQLVVIVYPVQFCVVKTDVHVSCLRNHVGLHVSVPFYAKIDLKILRQKGYYSSIPRFAEDNIEGEDVDTAEHTPIHFDVCVTDEEEDSDDSEEVSRMFLNFVG